MPPYEWPQSTTGPSAASIAAATARASSASPGGSAGSASIVGRSTAATRWPCASSSGATRSQTQLPPQAPCTSTIVLDTLQAYVVLGQAQSRRLRRGHVAELRELQTPVEVVASWRDMQ